jgi:hypothetical protein
MSSPIQPIDGPSGQATLTPVPGARADDTGAFLSELAAGADSLAVDASRGGPPPEVLDEIAAAARIEERLRESGQQLRFSSAPRAGRVAIELHDSQGGVVRALSAAEAIELAAGRPVG